MIDLTNSFYDFFKKLFKLSEIKEFFLSKYFNIEQQISEKVSFNRLKIIFFFFNYSDVTKIFLIFLLLGLTYGSFVSEIRFFNYLSIVFFILFYLSLKLIFVSSKLYLRSYDNVFIMLYILFSYHMKPLVKDWFFLFYNNFLKNNLKMLFEFSLTFVNLKRKLFVTGISISCLIYFFFVFMQINIESLEDCFFFKNYILVNEALGNWNTLASFTFFTNFIRESFLFCLTSIFVLFFTFLHIFYSLLNIIFDYLANKVLFKLIFLIFFMLSVGSSIFYWFFFFKHL